MVQRGEIYYVNLGSNIGSEQSGCRPVLIIQNNTGNKYSPTTIVATLTSKKKKYLPTHVFIKKDYCNGLECNSIVELEQIRTIDKKRLENKVGRLSEEDLDKVLEAIKTSLALF